MNGQLDAFEKPPWWEVCERDRILAVLAAVRRDYLLAIRTEMVRLVRAGRPYVTADDARTYFEGLPDVPPPDVLSRNFLGATFKTPEWEVCGWYLSQTPGSHANRLLKWMLRDE